MRETCRRALRRRRRRPTKAVAAVPTPKPPVVVVLNFMLVISTASHAFVVVPPNSRCEPRRQQSGRRWGPVVEWSDAGVGPPTRPDNYVAWGVSTTLLRMSGDDVSKGEREREESKDDEANSEEFVIPPVDQLVSDTPPEQRGIGVGIDLGTTNSAAAVLVDGVPTIVPVPGNGRTVPSIVSLLADDGRGNEADGDAAAARVLVGKDAIEAEGVGNNPGGVTYRNVKRVMGMGGSTAAISAEVVPNLVVRSASVRRKARSMGKHKSTVQPTLAQQLREAEESPARLRAPAPVRRGGEGMETETDPTIATTTVTPEEISAHVLRRLFDAVEVQRGTGEKVSRAVIGVPAYFNDAQRDATLRASKLAGVEKARLLREPEAAALAYGIGKEQAGERDDDELVLVFDLGGGTFDVSVLEVGGGVTEVVATAGNNMLGGSDFDSRVAEFMSKRMSAHGAERNYLRDGGDVADAMVRSAEAVRVHLSNNRVAILALPLTAEGWLRVENAGDVLLAPDDLGDDEADVDETGRSNSTHVLCKLSRKKMEDLCLDEFLALLKPVREVAILARAMLPGDANPEAVMAAMQMEDEMNRQRQAFEDFYDEERGEAASIEEEQETDIDPDILLKLKEIDVRERKKAQQRGRKKARNLAASSKNFRREKRKADEAAKFTPAKMTGKKGDNVKVRDGITGRPISRVVLVGGATRMPAIGRLLAATTGVVPQKTVNPDEAVALGCAVQVGILDGDEALGGLQVLNPFQAALMRGLAKKRGLDVEEREEEEELIP